MSARPDPAVLGRILDEEEAAMTQCELENRHVWRETSIGEYECSRCGEESRS